MKIVSWNVNGIRACIKRDSINPLIEKEKPDILCVQETKAQQDQVDKILHDFEHHYWNSAEKAGYSGTAIFSKIKPLSVTYGIGIEEHDQEGRVITLEFEDFYLVNVYVPNSGRELVRLKYRGKWDLDFLSHVKTCEKKKPVVVCGDFNVAHQAIDLTNPKSNYNKTAGYMQEEINGFTNFMNSGFVDTFRTLYPSEVKYSWWSYMSNARQKNIGWRIDFFLVSSSLKPRLKDAFILPTVMGSDHCPVGIIIQ